jgi:chloride channel protein, CIC family
LIPVGASAALAAAFNTPVAAVLFSLEEVMGDLHAPVLGSIVLSSATSWIVVHLLLGDEPLFHVPAYQLVSPVEFITYAILGLVGGVVSVCFVKLLLYIRKRFMSFPKWSDWLQPAAGGLLVGVMGWFVPEVLGVGYGHVSEALNGQMALHVMALLVVLKLVATTACYGTGNAGGIFGPSLFVGAMMGGAVGTVAHQLLPDFTGGVGAYALVGMGAAFAGIVRVPLTSVIMIFEMTRDYTIIVPLMISNLISYYISYKLQPEPIYEALAHQDGLHMPSGLRDRQGMLAVRDAAVSPPQRLTEHQRFDDALEFLNRDRNAWPVLDGETLLGMVTLPQAQEKAASGHGAEELGGILTARLPRELLESENFPHVHLDHPLDVALRRMAQAKWNVLPVVSRANVREFQGVVTLNSILEAYGFGQEKPRAAAPVIEQAMAGRRFVPGVIAAALALLMLIGFLNYYYRSSRGVRADQEYKTGTELARQQRHQEAIQQFRDALSVSPGNPRYRLALGLTLMEAGQLNEGAVYLREVLARDPENGPANLGLARIDASQGSMAGAIVHYHRALDGSWPAGAQPDRTEGRYELAALFEKTGQETQAIAELLAAAGQARDGASKKHVGQLLLEYGSPHEAADQLREVVRANPLDGEAYSGLGAAELAQGNYAPALDAFRNAARLNPGDKTAATQAELCERVLALDPDLPGLRAAERNRRSKAVLEGVTNAIEQCQAGSGVTDAARKALAAHTPANKLDDATQENLALAARLWKARPAPCVSAGGVGHQTTGVPVADAMSRILSRYAQTQK